MVACVSMHAAEHVPPPLRNVDGKCFGFHAVDESIRLTRVSVGVASVKKGLYRCLLIVVRAWNVCAAGHGVQMRNP